MQTTTYSVPGVSREHCRVTITGEVSRIAGAALAVAEPTAVAA